MLACIVYQVIDAEVARRKLLEDYPIPSINEDPVNFDTSEIPWWAWVRRFHLPEVSLLQLAYILISWVEPCTLYYDVTLSPLSFFPLKYVCPSNATLLYVFVSILAHGPSKLNKIHPENVA